MLTSSFWFSENKLKLVLLASSHQFQVQFLIQVVWHTTLCSTSYTPWGQELGVMGLIYSWGFFTQNISMRKSYRSWGHQIGMIIFWGHSFTKTVLVDRITKHNCAVKYCKQSKIKRVDKKETHFMFSIPHTLNQKSTNACRGFIFK